MKRFVLHPEAYTDIDEVWEYIASDNLGAADGIRDEIHEAIGGLVAFPYQGHKRTDLTTRPLRFLSGARLPDRLRAGRKATSCDCGFAWQAKSAGDFDHPQTETVGFIRPSTPHHYMPS
jgi:plasmid stabilization system protein ParE